MIELRCARGHLIGRLDTVRGVVECVCKGCTRHGRLFAYEFDAASGALLARRVRDKDARRPTLPGASRRPGTG